MLCAGERVDGGALRAAGRRRSRRVAECCAYHGDAVGDSLAKKGCGGGLLMVSGVRWRVIAAAAGGRQWPQQNEDRAGAVRAAEFRLGGVGCCAVARRFGPVAIAGGGGGWRRRRAVLLQQLPCPHQLGVHVAGGEQAVVANLGVAVGQDVRGSGG